MSKFLVYCILLLLSVFALFPSKTFAIDSNTKANWSFESQNNGTYKVHFTWEELSSNPKEYSIRISKIPGEDPGPYADTSARTWTFDNVTPGIWYVNIKSRTHGYWSRIYYWNVEVPEWQAPVNTSVESPYMSSGVGIIEQYPIYFLTTAGLSLFAFFSFLYMQKYTDMRETLNKATEAKNKSQQSITDNTYIHTILPPVVPLIEKPRKISHYRRYNRRYY